jgi:hypothetical protein
MKFVSKVVAIVLVVILSGCAKSLTKNEIETIHRVGIINHFPDYFTHMTIDLTMLGDHGFRKVQDLELKTFLGLELKDQLQEKGFTVVEVKNVPFYDAREQFLKNGLSMSMGNDNFSINNADLVIEIIPRPEGSMLNSIGYGFQHKKTLLGGEGRQFAYTSLELNLLVNGENRCGNCRSERMIEVSGMKLNWGELDEAKQTALLGILKLNIRATLEAALEASKL